MPTKLSVFNGALRLLGETRMIDADEDNKKGRELRQAWDDVVRGIFESYPWNCASERVALERLSDTPAHTYDYYYAKPDDWLRTIALTRSSNEQDKLRLYVDEAGGEAQPKGRLATSESTVFMRYISEDYLARIGNWPQNLADYVSAKLAYEACQAITGNNSKMDMLYREMSKRRHEATNWDTLQNPPQQLQTGRLVSARLRGIGRFGRSGGN